jgi:hypothetical protein
MDEFLQDVSSLRWWISVVVAGLVVNFVAAYSKPLMDRLVSRISTTRRLATEEKRRQFEERIETLLSNPERILDVKLDVLYYNLRAVLFMALSIFAFQLGVSTGSVFGFFLGVIPAALIYAYMMTYVWRSHQEQVVLREFYARKEQLESTPPSQDQ